MRLSMISWIIKTEVCVICRSRRLRQITPTRGFDKWMESNSVCNHTSDKENRTTAKREPDLLITSMITDWIGRHEVLLPINHKNYNFLARVCVICLSLRLRQITQTSVLIIHDIMRKPNSMIVLLYIFYIIHPQKQKRSVQTFCFWGEHS